MLLLDKDIHNLKINDELIFMQEVFPYPPFQEYWIDISVPDAVNISRKTVKSVFLKEGGTSNQTITYKFIKQGEIIIKIYNDHNKKKLLSTHYIKIE